MKIYRVEWDSCEKDKQGPQTVTTTKFDLVVRYLLDSEDKPEEYRNFKFFVGELEEINVKDLNLETLEKLFL